MGSSSSKPDLSNNELAVTRERKLTELMALWYKAVVQVEPPPPNDPNLLVFQTLTAYYYTSKIDFTWKLSDDLISIIAKTTVNWITVANTIIPALNNTTGDQTGEGYGTCVIQSFEGKYEGVPCIFKAIVVSISFNFSAKEYKTPEDVSALGYWIYWFRTPPPFRDDPGASEQTDAAPFVYQVPPDISVVGRKYMTVAELDRFNP